jgi:hypothetical protein
MSGGKGGKSQSTEPPKYQMPYLRDALIGSRQLYNQDFQNGQQYSQYGNQARDMVVNRATNGDPTINAAQGYVQNSLNGSFLNSNPYIDATFNRAAQATQGQLASQFAGSGRNVDQSQGQRSQQLNDLATQIYGGNYANERQLQQGALGYAQPLGNQSYADASALSGVGNTQGTALDQFLNRVNSAGSGSQVTGPGGNRLAGAAGGAMLGGSLFNNNPWAIGVGAGLGGLFG